MEWLAVIPFVPGILLTYDTAIDGNWTAPSLALVNFSAGIWLLAGAPGIL